MGLLPRSHGDTLTPALETKILETFSLQIINEYDLAHPGRWKGLPAKPKPFMATRYLQMQHKDKRGKTSGDGRSIWNGSLRAPDTAGPDGFDGRDGSKGIIFDVSSRGTGATILSPGASEADRPLPTGDTRYSYADGKADLDEMLGSALMSEIFYRQGIPTERCLAVIDYGDGSSVGVRTAPNLIRPAHIFRYLKMGNREGLARALNYFMDRQEENGFWKLPAHPAARLDRALEYIAKAYGRLAALLEEEYIFNWLSWDGDNVLADGSMLDYGSIRQFAAKSDKYRYADVDRYSTSLGEQRVWARLMVQAFAQAADFTATGRKKNLRNFSDTPCLLSFDREFLGERDRRLLHRIGFTAPQIEKLMRTSSGARAAFRKALAYFEDLKVSKGPEKLPDGITHRPVFLIRNLLRELPKILATGAFMTAEEFCAGMAASYVEKRDMQLTPTRIAYAREFQERYLDLARAAGRPLNETLSQLASRAAVINHAHRMTGDGMVWIIKEILAVKDRLGWEEMQVALDAFIESQILIPGKWKPIPEDDLKSPRLKGRLLRKIKKDLDLYKETI